MVIYLKSETLNIYVLGTRFQCQPSPKDCINTSWILTRVNHLTSVQYHIYNYVQYIYYVHIFTFTISDYRWPMMINNPKKLQQMILKYSIAKNLSVWDFRFNSQISQSTLPGNQEINTYRQPVVELGTSTTSGLAWKAPNENEDQKKI